MIDFPDNPTDGQRFPYNNVTYVWDDTKKCWYIEGALTDWLPTNGGTVTGPVVFVKSERDAEPYNDGIILFDQEYYAEDTNRFLLYRIDDDTVYPDQPTLGIAIVDGNADTGYLPTPSIGGTVAAFVSDTVGTDVAPASTVMNKTRADSQYMRGVATNAYATAFEAVQIRGNGPTQLTARGDLVGGIPDTSAWNNMVLFGRVGSSNDYRVGFAMRETGAKNVTEMRGWLGATHEDGTGIWNPIVTTHGPETFQGFNYEPLTVPPQFLDNTSGQTTGAYYAAGTAGNSYGAVLAMNYFSTRQQFLVATGSASPAAKVGSLQGGVYTWKTLTTASAALIDRMKARGMRVITEEIEDPITRDMVQEEDYEILEFLLDKIEALEARLP